MVIVFVLRMNWPGSLCVVRGVLGRSGWTSSCTCVVGAAYSCAFTLEPDAATQDTQELVAISRGPKCRLVVSEWHEHTRAQWETQSGTITTCYHSRSLTNKPSSTKPARVDASFPVLCAHIAASTWGCMRRLAHSCQMGCSSSMPSCKVCVRVRERERESNGIHPNKFTARARDVQKHRLQLVRGQWLHVALCCGARR